MINPTPNPTTHPTCPIELQVNGIPHTQTVEPRHTLADFLRNRLGLTGTHLGCEHGVCGACTVLLDGEPVRACIMLAVQANGREVITIEGLHSAEEALHPTQKALWEQFGLQCGFCTPGMLITMVDLLARKPNASDAEIRAELSGNLCRCTGYQPIVEAVKQAAATMAERRG